MSNNRSDGFKSFLLLAGSFSFAFLLGEMVHEFGHYLAHLAYGNPGGAAVHLDPFGNSRIVVAAVLPQRVAVVTSAAGPLFNLVLALAVFAALWRLRRPILLPLLIWAPVAMVQEGVTFSLGLLTPGGDARWVAAAGIPLFLILASGIFLLIAGVAGVTRLLPLAGLKQEDSIWRQIGVIIPGMGTLMIVRAMYSCTLSAAARLENLIPFIFTLLLSFAVLFLQKPVSRITGKTFSQQTHSISFLTVVLSMILGCGIFGLEVIL